MSKGLVVASTTGRPATRCSSMSIRAHGWTAPVSTLAASVAAVTTASDDQPAAYEAARRARAMPGSVSPITSKNR